MMHVSRRFRQVELNDICIAGGGATAFTDASSYEHPSLAFSPPLSADRHNIVQY